MGFPISSVSMGADLYNLFGKKIAKKASSFYQTYQPKFIRAVERKGVHSLVNAGFQGGTAYIGSAFGASQTGTTFIKSRRLSELSMPYGMYRRRTGYSRYPRRYSRPYSRYSRFRRSYRRY